MTRQQHPLAIGELVYDVAPWKIYRQDSGMGEHDYGVFRYGEFFCRTDNRNDSDEVIRCINHCTGDDLITRRSRSRSPAAAPVVDELEARFATKMEAWEQGFKDGKTAALVDLNIIKQQAAAEAWEKVLKEFESIMKISGIDHWDFRKGYEQKRGPTIPDHFTIFYSSGGCGSCTELEYQILKLLESLRREGEQHG